VTAADGQFFDNDRTIAALRRALASKEQELESANHELSVALAQASQLASKDQQLAHLRAELDSAQAAQAELRNSMADAANQHDEAMREFHIQLESTRAELVVTIEEKTGKIDALEASVLDLRKSREDLVIEDQQRLDEVKEKLEHAEKMGMQSDEVVRRLREEMEVGRKEKNEAEHARQENAEEVWKLKAELERLAAEHSAVDGELRSIRDEMVRTKNIASAQEEEVRQKEAAFSDQSRKIEVLLREKEETERLHAQAKETLEKYQRAAMANEAATISELREELAKARERAEKGEKETLAVQADCKAVLVQLKGERDEKDKVSAELEAQRIRADRAKEEARQIRDAAKGGDARLSELEARLSELRQALRSRDGTHKELEARLAAELLARKGMEEELKRTMEGTASKGEAARSAGEETQKLRFELAAVRQNLERRNAAYKELEAMLDAESSASKGVEVELQRAREEAAKETEAARFSGEEVRKLRLELDAAKLETADIKRVSVITEKKAKQAFDEVKRLEAVRSSLPTTVQLEELRLSLKKARQELTQARAEAATGKEAVMEIERLKMVQASLPTRREMEDLQASLRAAKGELSDAAKRVAVADESREAVAKELQEVNSRQSSLPSLQEVSNLQAALSTARRELEEAHAEILVANDRTRSLATELLEVKSRPPPLPTSSSSKWRHSTPAPFGDNSASMSSLPGLAGESLRLQALTTATTGVERSSASMRLRTRETEEIERLEKVVEAQKAMIDDQREKIKFWARVGETTWRDSWELMNAGAGTTA
jgi:centromeric protein E